MAALVLGLFLAFLGGFGTQQALSPAGRLLFWLSLVGTGYVLALAAGRLIGERPRNPVARSLIIALLSGLPQTFIVSWELVQVRPGRVIDVGDLPMLFVTVVAVQLVIVAVQAWLGRTPETNADLVPSALAGGRIPPTFRGDLVALEAEDHYVRVHHGAASTLILHRFGDAMAELDPSLGLQVHRGWWVALAAVAGTYTRGDKRWLRLTNGLDVPVSRTFAAAVRERKFPRRASPASD